MGRFAQDMIRLSDDIRASHERRSAFVGALQEDTRAKMDRFREDDQARAREHARRAAHISESLARFEKDRLEMARKAGKQRAAFVARTRRFVQDLRHETAEDLATARKAWAIRQV